jgi:hypothetical protein
LERGESPFLCLQHPDEHIMIHSDYASCKVLPFVVPRPSKELEESFRGVIQSNHDLMAALDRLLTSYKGLLGFGADREVLTAVEITLNNAKNAHSSP